MKRSLPLVTIPKGTTWYRIHRREHAPLWFGPAAGQPPCHRFDAPNGEYRVCYLGATLAGCFAEILLRNPPVEVIDLADLTARAVATIQLRRSLRLVPLSGPGLAKRGVTAEVTSRATYAEARALSSALWHHMARPDGLHHPSRHDTDCCCIALFDRARAAVRVVESVPLGTDHRLLGALLDRWELGLAP